MNVSRAEIRKAIRYERLNNESEGVTPNGHEGRAIAESLAEHMAGAGALGLSVIVEAGSHEYAVSVRRINTQSGGSPMQGIETADTADNLPGGMQ